MIQYIDANFEYEYPGAVTIVIEPPEEMADTEPEEPARYREGIMNQIRKWECHFDDKNLLSFLERIEELCQGYGYSRELLEIIMRPHPSMVSQLPDLVDILGGLR